MNNKIFGAALIAASLTLTGCNDSFLDKAPRTSLTEQNAFLEYDSYKAFMYPCYSLFTTNAIETNFNTCQDNSTFYGDWYAGVLTYRDNGRNPYAYETITQSTTNGLWDFSYIRRINVMLSHLNDGVLTPAEAAHWRSVGYYFSAWWYMELVDKFGDVPWVESTLTESSEETYAPRTPRAQVVDSIISRLNYAINNLGNFADGDNTLTVNAVKATLSRFLLREGTWAKYHGLDEPYEQYLRQCLEVSQDLMNQYPTLYTGTESYPAAGYGELFTTEDLTNVPGVIFFKQYLDGMVMHRFNDYEHIAAHAVDVPQYTVDMFLMKNGKPIGNPQSGYKGGKGKDMWDTFDSRDPRLYQNIQPPYVVKPGGSEDGGRTWSYLKAGDVNRGHTVTAEEAQKYRTYMDYLGANTACLRGGSFGGTGMKKVPGQNWGALLTQNSPNLTTNSTTAYMRCRTGYYTWKHYDLWEFSTGASSYCTSDKPIFKIEEVLLNYAEAAWELGQFNQDVADRTINKLRDRSGVARMTVSEITDDFDPNRDKGNAPWWTGKGGKFGNYNVDPVLWEIRRERMIELFGEGFSFYDVRRWAKAAWYVNRQPCGMWITANDNPYGTNNSQYSGNFVDYEKIQRDGQATGEENSVGSGWIYTYPSPLTSGGWLDAYYLEMVPTNQIVLNPNLTQNPGYNELFHIGENQESGNE